MNIPSTPIRPREKDLGVDFVVRAHPHIGLVTVTFLLKGAMLHRDSTGVVRRIEPGPARAVLIGGEPLGHRRHLW